jgi:trans-L-3-hydroxyproline dehydratase
MIAPLENLDWQPPPHWQKITTIEMHTGGEPLRVVTSGLPPIEGDTVLEKRRYFREHFDHIRRGIIWEPRGHADMYAAIITPSADADADVFFLHNEGYSTMCGHAIIALTKFVVETGLAPRDDRERRITFNVPAGKVYARALIEHGQVREASFRNVPSFLYLRDESIEVPELGLVHFDVAYGGAFYAFVDAESLGLSLTAGDYSRLIDYGRRIKHAVSSNYSIEHPFESDLSFLYGTIFMGPAQQPGNHSRNVCVFAEGEVDRSPTGTGVSARAAIHYAKGELQLNQRITIESIVGSVMTVAAVEQTEFGRFAAVIPEVTGTASITGRSEFYFDPDDPFREGFILR